MVCSISIMAADARPPRTQALEDRLAHARLDPASEPAQRRRHHRRQDADGDEREELCAIAMPALRPSLAPSLSPSFGGPDAATPIRLFARNFSPLPAPPQRGAPPDQGGAPSGSDKTTICGDFWEIWPIRPPIPSLLERDSVVLKTRDLQVFKPSSGLEPETPLLTMERLRQ